jgi:hypothetical protein
MKGKLITILVALTAQLACAHSDLSEEEAPKRASKYSSCIECVQQTAHYWCQATQLCYQYEGLVSSLEGADCTRPEDYMKIQRWQVPQSYAFSRDIFQACMTDYEQFPSTNTTSSIVTDCAFTFDLATGAKVTNQPARLIVDDQYLKSDELPNGAVQNYQIEPYSMCRIMLANTLKTNYRHYFNWNEQSFVYWTAHKPASKRFDRITVLWDQR